MGHVQQVSSAGNQHPQVDSIRNQNLAHVLVIPIHLHGHITPLFRLAFQLAKKGVTVTFVSYEEDLSRMRSRDGASVVLQGLDFRFVGLQKPERLQRGPKDWTLMLQTAFEPFMEKLMQERREGAAGPTSVLSDMFLPWTQEVAEKLEIPRYMFVPSGVIFAKAMDGMLDYYNSGRFQISETDGKLVKFDWPVLISGLPPLQYHELSYTLRNDPAFFRLICETVSQATGILVNSFYELEEKVIETWKSERVTEHKKVPKIYSVGTLFSTSVAPSNVTDAEGLQDSTTKCLSWLHSQPSSSVLYIAFGSQAHLHPEQINEVAHGLVDSEQRFLWVIPQEDGKEDNSVVNVLPSGFHARVEDRGYIMTDWAPQVQILAHPSTRGFLTHSGWNSALESIICGVPMISWPQAAEQDLNCRYLVDNLNVAIQIQTGSENAVKRKEVERVVRLLMIDSTGRAMKNKVEECRKKAALAMAEDGSSSKYFLEFLNDIG